jgi:hypothetical protein
VALTNFSLIGADEQHLLINNSVELTCLLDMEADKALHREVIEFFRVPQPRLLERFSHTHTRERGEEKRTRAHHTMPFLFIFHFPPTLASVSIELYNLRIYSDFIEFFSPPPATG